MRAEAVAARILAFLIEVGCTSKTVAQCYDGAAVMASGLHRVQARVKEAISQAFFIHCYVHTLNLSQGTAGNAKSSFPISLARQLFSQDHLNAQNYWMTFASTDCPELPHHSGRIHLAWSTQCTRVV